MAFAVKADRSGIPVKILVDGPSGSGKTYTCLEIASGLIDGTDGQIGIVDSQNGQSRRYAGTFDFFCEIIRDYSPATYISMIREAERAKLGALILDSATHEWSYCLDLVDSIAKRTGSSNNAWRDVTPAHKRFVEAIIQATVPILCTVRTKTEWLYTEELRNGRKQTVPHKVGTKPEQRDQFEFEFDLWLRMGRDHRAAVEKSVFPFIETDTEIGVPSRDIGRQIRAWFEGTSFDAEAALAERDADVAITRQRNAATQAARANPAPPSSPPPRRDTVSLPSVDPDPAPDDAADDEPEYDDDPEETGSHEHDAADDVPMSDERTGYYARYRTLAAVAVMNGRAGALKLASVNLDDLSDAEIDAEIRKLEQAYPNVKQTGAYQCDVCGRKIYPHVIEEFQGHEFPGLQLIAISVRDFQRALCPEHLAAERRKKKRRTP